MRTLKFVSPLLLALAMAGCSQPILFQVPVLQGNVLADEQIEQLEIGMTRPQVHFLLGTALLQSEFAPNRWDYVYYYRDRGGDVRESRLTLFFRDGKLARIEGGERYDALVPEQEQDIDPDLLERS